MEADPPRSACRRRSQTTLSGSGQDQCRERQGKGVDLCVRYGSRRRTPVNHHLHVESSRTASKPGCDVNLGQAHQRPVYWVSGARRKDGASLTRALVRNCRNLRHRCQGRRPSASTRGPEYQCDSAGADRLVVCARKLMQTSGCESRPAKVVADRLVSSLAGDVVTHGLKRRQKSRADWD